MLPIILIALAASILWLILDKIHQGKTYLFKDNWKKYVVCLVGGLLYGLLSDLKFFRWIAEVGVIALVANSFSVILTFLNWTIRALGFKKASL